MQLFSADATVFSNFFYENIKKWASKVAHDWPQTFFSQVWPGCPNQPRIDFSYYKYVPRLICLLICGKQPSSQSNQGCVSTIYLCLFITMKRAEFRIFMICNGNTSSSLPADKLFKDILTHFLYRKHKRAIVRRHLYFGNTSVWEDAGTCWPKHLHIV